MAPLPDLVRPWCWLGALVLLVAACSGGASVEDAVEEPALVELEDPPRRYSAEWLIDTSALDLDDTVASSLLYREVVDDQTGTYLVESPNHLALQRPEEVVFCAATSRVPLDPFCAAAPRAGGAPHVLAYPIQVIRRDWAPSSLYDLASYREVSLVAASDPDNWSIQAWSSVIAVPTRVGPAALSILSCGQLTTVAKGNMNSLLAIGHSGLWA